MRTLLLLVLAGAVAGSTTAPPDKSLVWGRPPPRAKDVPRGTDLHCACHSTHPPWIFDLDATGVKFHIAHKGERIPCLAEVRTGRNSGVVFAFDDPQRPNTVPLDRRVPVSGMSYLGPTSDWMNFCPCFALVDQHYYTLCGARIVTLHGQVMVSSRPLMPLMAGGPMYPCQPNSFGMVARVQRRGGMSELVVRQVCPKSTALALGLKVGDVLVGVNMRRLRPSENLATVFVEERRKGIRVIRVRRGGRLIDLRYRNRK